MTTTVKNLPANRPLSPHPVDANGVRLNIGDKVRKPGGTWEREIRAIGNPDIEQVRGLVRLEGSIAWESARKYEKAGSAKATSSRTIFIPDNVLGVAEGDQDVVELLRQHCESPAAVHFIADMLE